MHVNFPVLLSVDEIINSDQNGYSVYRNAALNQMPADTHSCRAFQPWVKKKTIF